MNPSIRWRQFVSMTMLLAMVSAYTVRTWHNPALHHHTACDAKNELHFHQQHEPCGLCDFVFTLIPPVNSPCHYILETRPVVSNQFLWIDALPGNVATGFSLRGPPYLA